MSLSAVRADPPPSVPLSVCGPCNSALSSKGGSGVSESTVAAAAAAPQMGRDGGRRDGRTDAGLGPTTTTAREGRGAEGGRR